MTDLVRLTGLGVRYPEAIALEGINLTVEAGERLAIIGGSGSGKSTLTLALTGLLPSNAITQGAIEWTGEPLVLGRDTGVVFQDPSASLNPVLTIGEQVAEGIVAHLGLGWRAALRRACALLEQVHLPNPEGLLRAYPHQLSGGQRQRVAIAAAIATGPRLLIADEATSALDTIVQAEIVSLLDGLVESMGMTLVFVTHDIALASQLADRIAVFHQGKLVELGSVDDVVLRPKAAHTSALLSAQLDLSTPPMIDGVAP